MHFRHDNCEFSWLVYGHGKARLAGNGRSLGKRRNAVRERKQANPKGVPVVSRSRVAALDKGAARDGPASEASALGLACTLRLAAKHHRDAESVIIMSKEH